MTNQEIRLRRVEDLSEEVADIRCMIQEAVHDGRIVVANRLAHKLQATCLRLAEAVTDMVELDDLPVELAGFLFQQ